MNKRLYGIRGATGAENTKESVISNVCEMCLRIVKDNEINTGDIVSIQFTQTKDLNLMNPAAALRKGQDEVDFSQVPLFCSQEPDIAGSPEKLVRVLFTVYLSENHAVKPVYINGGEKLRPDFAKKN